MEKHKRNNKKKEKVNTTYKEDYLFRVPSSAHVYFRVRIRIMVFELI
jgi:hypothetical protein